MSEVGIEPNQRRRRSPPLRPLTLTLPFATSSPNVATGYSITLFPCLFSPLPARRSRLLREFPPPASPGRRLLTLPQLRPPSGSSTRTHTTPAIYPPFLVTLR